MYVQYTQNILLDRVQCNVVRYIILNTKINIIQSEVVHALSAHLFVNFSL